jgi:hypothetical protein
MTPRQALLASGAGLVAVWCGSAFPALLGVPTAALGAILFMMGVIWW